MTREEAIYLLRNTAWLAPSLEPVDEAINMAIEALQVDLVRCGDCKHYNAGFECLKEGYGIEYPPTWFCADGERRGE